MKNLLKNILAKNVNMLQAILPLIGIILKSVLVSIPFFSHHTYTATLQHQKSIFFQAEESSDYSDSGEGNLTDFQRRLRATEMYPEIIHYYPKYKVEVSTYVYRLAQYF